VRTAEDLARARADCGAAGVVGFDTETRPAFRKGEVHLPCLAQVATAGAVYLFPLRDAAVHAVLTALLGNPQVVKAGVGLADDLRPLQQVFPFAEQGMLDLGRVARQQGFAQTGVRNLAGIVMGVRIPKGARTSNWAARELSAAQITYAATDAWVCRELCLRFEALGWLPAAR
jgi:ribonuclease D